MTTETTTTTIPAGWKLVPIEPTPEMREAFHEAHEQWEDGCHWKATAAGSPDWQWSAMLEAAPSPAPAAPSAAQWIDEILKAARELPPLKGITLTSQDPMAQARWLTALGDLQRAVSAYDDSRKDIENAGP